MNPSESGRAPRAIALIGALRRALGQSRWLWAVFAACMALTVAVGLLTPPFANPDEGAHYLRAFEVRHHHWVNSLGDVGIPIRCDEYVTVGKRYAPIANFQAHAVKNASDPLCRANTRNTAGVYPAIAYLPGAPALAAGEHLGWTVPARLKGARVLHGLLACALMFAGLLAMRRLRASFLLAGLLPMAFWQRAALSADSLLLGSVFLFLSWVVRLKERRERPTPLDWAVLLSTAVMIGSSKGVYGLLCLAPLALWRDRPDHVSSRRWALFLGAPFVTAVALAVIWTRLADPGLVNLANGAQPAEQLRLIFTRPGILLRAITRTVASSGLDFLRQVTGHFSWLPQAAGAAVCALLLPLFAPLMATEPTPFRLRQRLFFGALVVGTTLACLLPLYLTYTPPGERAIFGFQGRYLLPIVPLLVLALAFEAKEAIRLSPPVRVAIAAGIPTAILITLLLRLA